MKDNKYRIEVLDNALDVLEELLRAGGESLNPTTISRKLGISRGRVFRILKTLEPRGYTAYEHNTRGYRLGLSFMEMGESVREGIDLRKVASPHLPALGQITGATVDLMVMRDNYAISIERYYGGSNLEGDAIAGFPHPLHVGGSPKLLLAHLPELIRNRIVEHMELTRFTPTTITDRRELYRRLEQIRAQGYSINNGEYVPDVFAVGAPIFDRTGNVVAGLSTSFSSNSLNEEEKQNQIEMTVSTAKEISVNLGHIDN